MSVRAAFGDVPTSEIVVRMTETGHSFRISATAEEGMPQAVLTAAEASDPWSHFTGDFGQIQVVNKDLIRFGLGDLRRFTAEDARQAGRDAARTLIARACAERLAVDLTVLTEVGGTMLIEAFIIGFRAASEASAAVTFVLPQSAQLPSQRLDWAVAVGDALWFASCLIEAPANLLTPESFAGIATSVCEKLGVTTELKDQQTLENENFGGILAVGQGSENKSCLIDIGRTDSPDLVLVGKGVTFDSGGLSLKSPGGMQLMRTDMTGAATALAVVAALARCGLHRGVRAVLPVVENMPGRGASRPGDIIIGFDGTRIQMMDTDFEGRVILADALAYGSQGGPGGLISVSTLTHQAGVALGGKIAAILPRDEEFGDELRQAADRTGDPMWPLPWYRRYISQVRLSSTTVRNHPLSDRGRAITAGLFLGEFVPSHIPFVHLDMGGANWVGDPSTGQATGSTLFALAELAYGQAVGSAV